MWPDLRFLGSKSPNTLPVMEDHTTLAMLRAESVGTTSKEDFDDCEWIKGNQTATKLIGGENLELWKLCQGVEMKHCPFRLEALHCFSAKRIR